MAVKWVLLKHEETGAVHRFPARTADAWAARGWQLHEPPESPKPAARSPKSSAAPAASGKE